MKITFIGAGNMASALIGGMIAKGMSVSDVQAVDPSDAIRDKVSKSHGITVSEKASADFIGDSTCVLAIKPQVMQAVATELGPLLNDNLVISVAAGTRAADIARWLGNHSRIVRAMPNTPALIGHGVTGLFGPDVSAQDKSSAESILGAVGPAIWVDSEPLLDSVTAVSGSGPAYVFRWMEAMQQAGEELGLNTEQVKTLVQHTVRGAAELAMRSDESISQLRENVTSKGGTTAAGLAAMNAADIERAIAEGVKAAHARSVEMGDELGSE
jgi:pyrroline-5-carboxylate reductase